MKSYLASISATAVLMFTAPMQAQDIESDLATCAAVKNPLERLVCFDDLVAGKSIAPSAQTELARNGLQGARQETRKNSVDDFGSEHVTNSDDESNGSVGKIYVTIESYSENSYGQLRFVTTDGQVWQQQSAERFPIDQDAEYFIERGMFSAYYLGRTDLNVRTRVRRIK